MRYNRIDPRFWTDRAVRGWSDDAKLLALYLLTSPHRTTEGLFRLPKAYIQADLEWSAERLGQPFRQLLESRFLDCDDDAQVVLIRNALKYQPLQNDNQVTGALNALEELPPTRLAWDFKQLAEQFCQRLAKRLPQGFGEPTPTSPAPSPPPTPTPAPALTPKKGANAPVPQAGPVSITRQLDDFWRTERGKDERTKHTPARQRAIDVALKAGYPPDDIRDAIRGVALDPWPDRGKNDDLTIILRLGGRGTRNNLEHFRDLWRAQHDPRTAEQRDADLLVEVERAREARHQRKLAARGEAS